jgi:hypothetical protein
VRALAAHALVVALLLLASVGATAPTGFVVGGVDLAEASFPSSYGTVHLHNGQWDNGDWPDLHLEEVVSGAVGTRTVAIARIRYELPATGFDASAEAFVIQGGSAVWLGQVGSYAYFSDTGPYVKTWYVASFAGDRFFVDRWDSTQQCDPRADWVLTTYTVRGTTLVTLARAHHHRAGTPVACVKG